MQPEELAGVLTSMAVAADVIEALDDPTFRDRHGWLLAGWSFDLIPWGVRFLHHGKGTQRKSAVVALALPQTSRAALPPAFLPPNCPTTLLFFG
jgi:hypothetical protein